MPLPLVPTAGAAATAGKVKEVYRSAVDLVSIERKRSLATTGRQNENLFLSKPVNNPARTAPFGLETLVGNPLRAVVMGPRAVPAALGISVSR